MGRGSALICFSFPVENEPQNTKWVLSVNIFPGGLTGGSGNQYFVGNFDGTTFSNDVPLEQTLWADYGRDFYASISFSDIPQADGRRIWIGWLNNWEYAPKVPTSPWRGAQSIPRELKLRRFPEGVRLVQHPARELRALRKQHASVKNQDIESANRWLQRKRVSGELLEIVAEIELENAAEAGFSVRKGPDQETLIGVDTQRSQLFVDRTRSGNVNFSEHFSGRHAGPITLTQKRVQLHIFLDRASVEVFGNHGERVISEVIFPAAGDGLELYVKGGRAHIGKLDIWKLSSSYE